MNGLMPQTATRSFNKLLPSEPLYLKRFGFDYAGIGVIYNLGRIMSWHLHSDEIEGDYTRRMRKFRRDARAGDRAFAQKWGQQDAGGEPLKDADGGYLYDTTLPGLSDALDERADEVERGMADWNALNRAQTKARWDYLVIGLEWPYADPPNARDFDEVADTLEWAVIEWITSDDALLEVAQQIGNPKENQASQPVT